MNRRKKIMVICNTIDKTRLECLEWWSVLEEHLGKSVKCLTYERRVETPYAIIDFVPGIPEGAKGYKVTFNVDEDNEKILRLAIGEEVL